MMTELLRTTFDGTPIPTSSSLDTSVFAHVPHEDNKSHDPTPTPQDTAASSPNDSESDTGSDTGSDMGSETPDALGRSSSDPESVQSNTTTNNTVAKDTMQFTQASASSITEPPKNVFLNVARVLMVIVVLLSVLYLVYWVLQNIYGIDLWESLKEVCGWSSLSKQFATPLSEWNSKQNTSHVSNAPTTNNTNNTIELSDTPQQHTMTDLPNTNHHNLPANQNVSASIIEPIKNMFGMDSNTVPSQAQAPHADGRFHSPYSGPLTKEGTEMKKTLSDKTVSTLLDMMAQIK